jgi:hypothetical protein
MKTDDPSLEKRRQEMFERVGKMNALTLAVLRSHLLAEQCMGDYIIKQKFSAKMERCKKLAKDEGDGELWGGGTECRQPASQHYRPHPFAGEDHRENEPTERSVPYMPDSRTGCRSRRLVR